MQPQTGLFPKLNLLFKLTFERLNIIFKAKNNWKQELSFSGSLIKDFIFNNFSVAEKLFCGVIILVFYVSFTLIYDFITYATIDKALRNQQSAKAESLIRQRLLFSPDDNSLKLRLAHAYLTLGRGVEAKNLIEEVQSIDPKNSYLGKVARELAIHLRLSKKEYQAIPILEKIPLNSCKDCVNELLELYTTEGRHSLLHKNLERANYFLSRALKLAEKVKESNSSVNHRKRELAKAYNMQAQQLIRAKQINNAIKILEISKDIFPIGQTYAILGKLYLAKKEISINELKKSLDCSDKAYSFGLVESETDFRQALKLLKQKLKQKGLSPKEIDEEVQGFQLSSVTIAQESAKEIMAENKSKLSEIKQKEKTEEQIQEKKEEEKQEIDSPPHTALVKEESHKAPLPAPAQNIKKDSPPAENENKAPNRKKPTMYGDNPYQDQQPSSAENLPAQQPVEYTRPPLPDN